VRKTSRKESQIKPWNRVTPWWGSESFGGLPKGRSAKTNPKGQRPFSEKCAIHVVLRSSNAVGKKSFRSAANFALVQRVMTETARLYRVKLHKTANVGNHLHLLIAAPNREAFTKFLRKLSALIACRISGGRRGQPRAKFWTGRPFSRLVNGGPRAFWRAESYVILNELEAVGILPPRSLARLGPAGFGKRTRLLSLARRIFEGL
jgi:REP element-mobilizing transposase RayT